MSNNDKSYFVDDLYVAIPSSVSDKESDSIVQKPRDITIITKTSENEYTDLIYDEDIKFYDNEELEFKKKYIGVFKNDYVNLNKYILSMKTDYVDNFSSYVKIILRLKSFYSHDQLEEIHNFIKKETYNFNCEQEKRINNVKVKRRIKK